MMILDAVCNALNRMFYRDDSRCLFWIDDDELDRFFRRLLFVGPEASELCGFKPDGSRSFLIMQNFLANHCGDGPHSLKAHVHLILSDDAHFPSG